MFPAAARLVSVRFTDSLGEGIPMHHTLGKLAALAVVVGIGVAVVIHAQRNMQSDDPTAVSDADEKSPDSASPLDADLPPDQDEPEFAAADDLDIVPAADKMASKPRRDNRIVKAGAAPKSNAVAIDDDDDAGSSLTKSLPSATSDPFATDDEDESETGAGSTPPRALAATSRQKIDIVDIDDDSSAADKSPPKSKRPPAGGSRGAVLSLDDPDDRQSAPPSPPKAIKRPKPAAGPRLLGATDDLPADPLPAEIPDDDPLLDDDSTSSTASRSDSLAVDEDLPDDVDSRADESTGPPRKLSTGTTPGHPKPQTPKADVEDEDDISIDRPTTRLRESAEDFPGRTGPGKAVDEETDEPDLELSKPPAALERRPAELDRTIEIDDATPAAPPRKTPLPSITIEKLAPATAVLGRPMVYTIHVRNVGKIAAHQVVVEDVIPTEVRIDGSIPQALLKDDRLIWKLGTLPAGQEKKISVRVIPQSEGTIGGVATVNFAAEPQQAKAPTPQLKFDITAPKQAAVGTPVEFNFHVRNVGTVPAHRVMIRDVLPAGLKHPDGDDLEYNLGELPAGKSQDIKLMLTAAQAGPTINRVVVTADGDVAEEAQVQLDVLGPTLLLSRHGPKRMFPDKTANFSNTVSNPGTTQVTGVTIIEKIPPGMEFVSAGDGGIYDQTKRSVFWSIKQLMAGEARTVTVSLRTVARGAQISVIRAFDSSGSTGEATAATKVAGAPALTIELGEIPALVEPGETVKIPLRILNRGSDTAGGVRATITVPAELKIVSADGPTSHIEKPAAQSDKDSGNSIEVQFAPVEKIEPKGDAIFELTVKARATGAIHIDVQAVCDQLPDSIRRQEVINIVNP